MRTILLIVFLLSTTYQLKAQCTFTGISNGEPYSVTVNLEIANYNQTCYENSFNYSVDINYEIIVSGTAPNLYTLQGYLICENGSDANYFNLPNNFENSTGTTTTATATYESSTCSNTPFEEICTNVNIEIKGEGLPNQITPCDIAMLPIELNYFTAEVTNNQQVQLNWQTLSEVNNDFFTIEYSYNGVNWNNLDTIQGNGTTQVSQNYSYLHTNPLGEEMFYRLKQTDFDGNYTYSDITQVTLEQEINLISYPNPVRDYGIIEYPGNQLITIETVVNVFGKQFTVNAQRLAPNQIQIDFQSLPSGLYFIKTNFGTVKFLKL